MVKLPTLCCLMLCGACAAPVTQVTRLVVVPVPKELRTPCEKPSLDAQTVADVARIVVGMEAAKDCDAAKIKEIDGLLTEAERLASEAPQ